MESGSQVYKMRHEHFGINRHDKTLKTIYPIRDLTQITDDPAFACIKQAYTATLVQNNAEGEEAENNIIRNPPQQKAIEEWRENENNSETQIQ